MKVFVTNLPTSLERHAHIKKQLDFYDLDYEFVECVIGKDLTEEQIARDCDLAELQALQNDVEWLNKGMIGCSLTSRKIHDQIVKRQLKAGMLLEDDAVLPENIRKIIEDCESAIRPGDVVLLYWIGWDEILLDGKSEIALESVSLYEPLNPEKIAGGTATIFSYDAAKGLCDKNYPIRITPDCWNDLMGMGAFSRLLCAHPRPVQTADFMSTMELGRFVWLRRLINKYRIFPAYQLLKIKRRKFKEKMMKVRVV